MMLPRLSAIIPRLNLSVPSSLFLIYAICLSPIVLLLYYETSSARSSSRQPKGCRKLGLKNFSNLNDEFEYGTDGRRRSSKRRDESRNGDGKIRIKALMAYPIKSCAGIEFNVADIIETGMKYDRLFAFAEFVENTTTTSTSTEKPPGRWVTRTMRDAKYSKLALVHPEIWVPDPSSPSYHPKRPEVLSNGVLVINYPRPLPNNPVSRSVTRLLRSLRLISRIESFQVPLDPPTGHTYPSAPLRVWRDSPSSLNYGIHLPPSLRTFLQIPLSRKFTLFRSDAAHTRTIFRCAPRKEEIGFQPNTGFADAYPLHLLSISSVRDVAGRVDQTMIPRLTVRRFRANIILEGAEKYAEDDWKQVSFVPGLNARRTIATRNGEGDGEAKQKEEEEGVKVYTSCRTVRCRLPNVDPDTGERHMVEPDKTLKSFRCIDGGDPKNACLGMQLVPAVKEFKLHVGDEVRVLATGEHFYIKI